MSSKSQKDELGDKTKAREGGGDDKGVVVKGRYSTEPKQPQLSVKLT